MIANLLAAILLLLLAAILLAGLAVVVAIRDGVQAIGDNVHRIRSRLELDGRRIEDVLAAAERIDAHVGDLYRAEKRRRPSEF